KRELLAHGIGNKPVAKKQSAHTRGQAVDVSVTLPPGVSIDDLAVGTNLVRPEKTRVSDPVHFVDPLDEPLAGRIALDGNVDILVTGAAGHRVGLDPITRAVVNELGADATYSGVGIRPQVIELMDAAPGGFVISGIPGASGAYSVEIDTADGDTIL